MGKNVNFEMKFAMCPSGCLEDGVVQGRGIHNPMSNVCAAAIADGSMPKSGGCIGLGKTNGLSAYAKAKLSNGVKI